MRILFILFAVMPIVEIFLLLQVGEMIGGWNTVGLVLLTAFFGAYFVRQEGFSTLQKAQQKMQQNQVPGKEMVEGLMLVVAGVLLVTPGLITDILGFLIVLPGSRQLLAAAALKHMSAQVVHSQFHAQQQWQQPQRRDAQGDIIEGEYTDNTQHPEHKKLDK